MTQALLKVVFSFMHITLLSSLVHAAPASSSHCDQLLSSNNWSSHSWSNPDAVLTAHMTLNLSVDFESQRVAGTVAYDLDRINQSADLVLDVKDIEIINVRDKDTGQLLSWSIGQEDKFKLGNPLNIKLGDHTKGVVIQYVASPGATQWLSAEQTSTGEPFMYTISQPVHSRNWLPSQDRPSVRVSYDATLRVPKGLLALMSAPNNPKTPSADGIYHFSMPRKIPMYLVAMAVGKLDYHTFSENTGVYAESKVMPAAVTELKRLPDILRIGERLFGNYRSLWGQFDILIMPMGFPYGGMENPTLTYASQTILSGDGSGLGVIAHELAHSWSGNLVTNASWPDFFLNEGTTRYLEYLLLSEFDSSGGSAEFQRHHSFQRLMGAIQSLGENSPQTIMATSADHHPDDLVGPIAYEKGFSMFLALEEVMGRKKLIRVLLEYFSAFQFKSVSAADFKEFFESRMSEEEIRNARLNSWLFEPGLPANMPIYEKKTLAIVDSALAEWLKRGVIDGIGANLNNENNVVYFIDKLPNLSIEQVEQLENKFKWMQSPSPVIRSKWFTFLLKNNFAVPKDHLERFVAVVGRGILLAPVYQALVNKDAELAKSLFSAYRQRLAPPVARRLERVVSGEGTY